jgi:hypothetical protein
VRPDAPLAAHPRAPCPYPTYLNRIPSHVPRSRGTPQGC